MTSKEFVIWLKGFSKAANSYNITPAQWDEIQDELAKVNDGGFSIGVGGQGTPNGTIPATGFIVTTSPGTTITTTPNGMSTSTTYGYPSGSAWHYTSTQPEPTTPKSEKQLLTDNHD